MNIALVGFGKMGYAIEQAAISRGHNIVLRITSANREQLNAVHLKGVDVAIEFTRPEAAKNNVLECLSAGVSVISGTTGWNDGLAESQAMAAKQKVAFLHASNFSIGVNLFFEVNKVLATLMRGHTEYTTTIEETHHLQKKDAPSGTAITLAEQIIQNNPGKDHWILNGLHEAGELPIIAHRIDNVPGTHKITYSSPIDDIEITHTAHNRDGFAFGAVLAAEYINGRHGIYTMKDVLGIK